MITDELISIVLKLIIIGTILLILSYINMRLWYKYDNHNWSKTGFKIYHFAYSLYDGIRSLYIFKLCIIGLILLIGWIISLELKL